jgi:O-methyltransferase
MKIIRTAWQLLEKINNRSDVDFSILVRIAKLISSGYRFKWLQLDWWYHKNFSSYLSKFNEIDGFNSDRKWALNQLLRLTYGVQGDTAGCGSFLGIFDLPSKPFE